MSATVFKKVLLNLVFMGALMLNGVTATAGEATEKALARIPPPPTLKCRAAVLLDMRTGNVLFSKNPDEKRSPASITKVMTVLLAVERGNLDAEVFIPAAAAGIGGKKARIVPGTRVRMESLLWAILVYSGNDTAYALARHVGGTEPEFIKLMNRRAEELGLKNTHFMNSHGLTQQGHYSTARDLAILSREALKNPLLRKMVSSKFVYFSEFGGREDLELESTNNLLWEMPDALGIKTGYTAAAGHCLASMARRDGRELIAIVLGSDKENYWRDAQAMLEYGFNLPSTQINPAPPLPLKGGHISGSQ